MEINSTASINSEGFNTLKFTRSATNPSDVQSDYPTLHELIRPHIDSFNSIFDDQLLDLALHNLEVREVVDPAGNRLNCMSGNLFPSFNTFIVWLEEVQVAKPMLSEKEHRSLNRFVNASECRERGVSY